MKQLLSLFLLISLISSYTLVQPIAVYAQRPTPDVQCVDGAGNPDPNQTYIAIVNDCVYVSAFLTFMLNLFIIAGVLAGVYRISLGFFLINTALGDPSKLQAGREALTEAVVGLLIVVGSWALIRFMESFAPANWFLNLT
jgi:hypothetical protein